MPQNTRSIEAYDRWVQDSTTERVIGIQLQSQSAPQYFGSYIPPGGQSAVPVMIAQSGWIASGGLPGALLPGVESAPTITFSATSGAGVTVTFGSATLTGTSADVGKQITFWDLGSSVFRSALITAFSSTTACTATLASTVSSTSLASTYTAVGSPLPTNYTGGIWVYLPAGAVSGGAAGFYWATATSTATANGILQVTTAYQATMGTPSIPSGFSNAVGSGSNFTQTTSSIVMASTLLPGGAMGNNGALRTNFHFQTIGLPGNGRSFYLDFVGSPNHLWTDNNDPLVGQLIGQVIVQNRGTQQFQKPSIQGYQTPGIGRLSGPAIGSSAVDTSQNQTVALSGQLSVATDFIVLEGFTVEVLPGA